MAEAGKPVLEQRIQTLLGERGSDTGERAVRVKEVDKLVSDALNGFGDGYFKLVTITKITTDHLISDGDIGHVLSVNAESDVTMSLPADAKVGSSILFVRSGPGEVKFAALSGAVIRCFVAGHSRIGARWGIVTLLCLSNDGSDTVWLMSGQTA